MCQATTIKESNAKHGKTVLRDPMSNEKAFADGRGNALPEEKGQLQRAEGGQGRDDKSAHSVGRLTSDAAKSHVASVCQST